MKNKNLHINPLLFLTECLGGAAYTENRRITFLAFFLSNWDEKFLSGTERMQKLSNSSNERVLSTAIEPSKWDHLGVVRKFRKAGVNFLHSVEL